MGNNYAYQVYLVDKWGKTHHSEIIYDEEEANEFADNRMYGGAMYYDAPRLIILEI